MSSWSHLHVLDLVSVFVAVGRLVLTFGDLDVPVKAVVFVLTFLLVVGTYLLAVCTVLNPVYVVSLEVLVLAGKNSLAMLLVLLKLALEHFLFFVVVGDFSSAVLHVILERPVVDSIADLQLPFTMLLPISVLSLVVVAIGPGQRSLPMKLVALDATSIMGS
jgi:hypothetical protein